MNSKSICNRVIEEIRHEREIAFDSLRRRHVETRLVCTKLEEDHCERIIPINDAREDDVRETNERTHEQTRFQTPKLKQDCVRNTTQSNDNRESTRIVADWKRFFLMN